jgi:hypothetical protein
MATQPTDLRRNLLTTLMTSSLVVGSSVPAKAKARPESVMAENNNPTLVIHKCMIPDLLLTA